MHISEFKDSKFLRKEDCGKGILVTIDHIEPRNVASAGAPPEEKFCLLFQEDINPMVLNTTNARLIASITGSEETDDWKGHQIVCYNDPTIAYAGKITGGIRVRAPKLKPAPAPVVQAPVAYQPAPAQPVHRLAPVPAPADDDDVPF